MRILRITQGQHSALISIVGTYMRVLRDDVQEFVDCSQDPPEVVTSAELLNLFMNMGGIEVTGEAAKRKPAAIAIHRFDQLRVMIADIFGEGSASHGLARDLIETAYACGQVEAMRDLEAKKKLETMPPQTGLTQ